MIPKALGLLRHTGQYGSLASVYLLLTLLFIPSALAQGRKSLSGGDHVGNQIPALPVAILNLDTYLKTSGKDKSTALAELRNSAERAGLGLVLDVSASPSQVLWASNLTEWDAMLKSGASAPEPSLAIINIKEAIVNSRQGQREFESLQEKFDPKRAELETMNKEVDELQKKFNYLQNRLNDDARAELLREIDSKKKVLQKTYEDANTDIQDQQGEILKRIGQKIELVLEQYAKASGFTVVLNISGTNPVLWATASKDITKEIVSAFDFGSVGKHSGDNHSVFATINIMTAIQSTREGKIEFASVGTDTNKRNEIYNRISRKMMTVLDYYAKSHELALVFDTSGAASPVLYAATNTDITSQIVSTYDSEPLLSG